jgi:excinuclease ABC subunit C
VIQQLRNEAHRFGVTFHRQKRSKQALQGELETIPGIGEKTAVELMRKFKSTKRIANASLEDLSEVVGISRATKIKNHFQSLK